MWEHTRTHTPTPMGIMAPCPFPSQENLQEAPAENRHTVAGSQQEPVGARGH